MASEITLEQLVGDGPSVLAALAADPEFISHKFKSIGYAMERCSILARGLVVKSLFGLVHPEMTARYAAFVRFNGVRKDDSLDWVDWDEAIDDDMALVFEPYAKHLSADWLATHTIDTRVHLEGELDKLAASFASEVWKQLTYGKNTPAKILSAVGVVEADVQVFLDALNTLNNAITNPILELEPDMNMNKVLNTAMLFTGGAVNPGDFALVLDDTDEYLAVQAANRLGIETDDIETLRMAALNGYDADQMMALVEASEILDEADDAPDGQLELVEGADADREAAVVTALGAPPPVPAGVTVETGAVPPAATGRKRRSSASPPANAVPPEVLTAFKTHANLKDDDVAGVLGLSRSSYNNYVKGRQPFVPTDDQRAALRSLVRTQINGLLNALAMYDGTTYGTIE